MSSSYPEFLERFRQPEYTGDNRCVPCTIVNSVIALVLATVVGLALASAVSPTVGVGAGAVVLVVSALAIALRGYLVPGTPTLTKRYFPDRVLAWFDKQPDSLREHHEPEGEEIEHWRDEIDGDHVEEVLQDAGALEECADVDDLCVTESFQEVWWESIDELREGDRGRRQLSEIVDADPEEVSLEDMDGVFMVKEGRASLGKWESEAAFIADMGAAAALEEVYPDGWADLDIRQRSAVLNGVRVFLERCPKCDGLVTLGEETVESCCREFEVVAVSCEDCGARLFETGNDVEASMPHP